MADKPNLGGMFDRDNPWRVNEGGTTPEKPKLSQEERARILAGEVRSYYGNYLTTQGDERQAYRDLALRAHRELVAQVGEQEAQRLEGEAANIPEEKEEPGNNPSLDWLYAYFADHPVKATVNGKPVTLDPKKIPPDQLQEIYRIQAHVDQTNGDDNSADVLDDFTAGVRGPTAEQLAAMAAARQEQQRQKQEERAERERRNAERERIRQEFAEQQAEAKRKRDEALDAERRKAAESAEQRAAKKEADRQEDRLLNWQLRGHQEARITTREDLAQQDRAQRAAERAQEKQSAAARVLASAEARRRQIAADTAARAASMLARTQVRLEALPTPGGIGLLLLAIVFILFAIQPSNAAGNTRLQLMWMALVGSVKLPTDVEQPGGVGSAIAAGIGAAVGAGFAPFRSGAGSGAGSSIGAPFIFDPNAAVGAGLGTPITTGNQPFAAAGGAGALPFLGTLPADMALDSELPYALRSQ